MKKKKILVFLMLAVMLTSFTACGSKKAERIYNELLGETFTYKFVTDDVLWAVNGYRGVYTGTIYIHEDGSITDIYKEEYTYKEDSPYKSVYKDFYSEETYDFFEVSVKGKQIIMDIEGYGVMKWYVSTDSGGHPDSISTSGLVYRIR